MWHWQLLLVQTLSPLTRSEFVFLYLLVLPVMKVIPENQYLTVFFFWGGGDAGGLYYAINIWELGRVLEIYYSVQSESVFKFA